MMTFVLVFFFLGGLGLAAYNTAARRQRTANAAAGYQPNATPRAAAAQLLPPAAQTLPAPAANAPAAPSQSTALFTNTPPDQRGHTAIGSKPGDGKTQSQISLMVQDIARGADVYWLNPQMTLFHEKDQPIDLRPISHLFTAIDDYAQIMAVLEAAYQLGETRKPLYKAGLDVGHNVVLHLDEWPAIFATLGDPVAQLVQRILRECRKLNIWIVLGAQDFLVDTTGFSSGVRATFNTKLVGNVDETTWRTLLGTGQKKAPVTKGTWMTEDGLAQVVRPSPALVARMAGMQRRAYAGALAAAPAKSSSILTPKPAPISEPLALLQAGQALPFDDEQPATATETDPKQISETETNVSPIAISKTNDAPSFPSVDFVPLARLVRAGLVGETKCLETALNVKAGSSKDYLAARTALKAALEMLDKETA